MILSKNGKELMDGPQQRISQMYYLSKFEIVLNINTRPYSGTIKRTIGIAGHLNTQELFALIYTMDGDFSLSIYGYIITLDFTYMDIMA